MRVSEWKRASERVGACVRVSEWDRASERVGACE